MEPGGAGDDGGYLQNASAGFGLGGSRQVMFNLNQWTGDYVAAGVTRITADLLNAGGTELSVRLALGRGDNPQTATWYASSEPFVLAVGGTEWQTAEFDLSEEALMLVNGAGSLAEVLANVDRLRILSSTVPSFQGDSIAAILAVDNITATVVPEPASVVLAVLGLLVLAGGRRRRSG
jgi:MYXO-CTERM domain-containing protein